MQKHLYVPFIALLAGLLAHPAIAAPKLKTSNSTAKERLVLMPLRIAEEDANLRGAMESALVEGLENKYEVFAGDRVRQKAKEIFSKESKTTKHDCDETRCMQDIAQAFQAELIGIATVTKQGDGYFLALSIQNIFDEKAVYTRSLPCKGCDAYAIVDRLKELAGSPVTTPGVDRESEAFKIGTTDPDSITWAEAQKGNTIDDYQVYLNAYPKGKYVPFAKAKIKKLQEAAQVAAEQQEQQAWDTAQRENSEDSYNHYLKAYPNGRFAAFAKLRLDKLRTDLAFKEESDLWKKAETGNDRASVEAYLNKYPSGRYITAASAKLKAIKDTDESALARGTTPSFYSCNSHAECAPGNVCVDNGGDHQYYCKPICSNDDQCRSWPYPQLRCYSHKRSDGTLFPYRVCNDNPSSLK